MQSLVCLKSFNAASSLCSENDFLVSRGIIENLIMNFTPTQISQAPITVPAVKHFKSCVQYLFRKRHHHVTRTTVRPDLVLPGWGS